MLSPAILESVLVRGQLFPFTESECQRGPKSGAALKGIKSTQILVGRRPAMRQATASLCQATVVASGGDSGT